MLVLPRSMILAAAATLTIVAGACMTSSSTTTGSGGSGGSAGSSTSAGAGAGGMLDGGDDAGDASDGAVGPQPVYTDAAHKLMWQGTQKLATEVWSDAVKYCDNLVWGGYDDWRLPTIDELRTTVLGCAASESGGACGVGAACLQETCGAMSCDGCPGMQGPTQGCYRIADLEGDCSLTWSSSVDPGAPLGAWYVNFSNARIKYDDQTLYHAIRCVRDAK